MLLFMLLFYLSLQRVIHFYAPKLQKIKQRIVITSKLHTRFCFAVGIKNKNRSPPCGFVRIFVFDNCVS